MLATDPATDDDITVVRSGMAEGQMGEAPFLATQFPDNPGRARTDARYTRPGLSGPGPLPALRGISRTTTPCMR
jgi:hypothetical protein